MYISKKVDLNNENNKNIVEAIIKHLYNLFITDLEKYNYAKSQLGSLLKPIEPLPLIEVGDSRFIGLVTYYLHEPYFRTVPALVYFYIA